MDSIILEKEAMKLSEGDRALLADRLLQSVTHTPDSLTKAWIDESADRLQAYRDGRLDSIEGQEALRLIRDQVKK